MGVMRTVLSEDKVARFERDHELDFAYDAGSIGRFRVNAFRQRGEVGMVMRRISAEIPTAAQLNLPKAVIDLAKEERGLVLVTGVTGSGKSTSLASLINYINVSRSAHIITIEDPIEYIFSDRRSIINQREVGMDTLSFGNALRAALREDPDVILVGEMRDKETIETAFKAASTGHLVFSTLHTLDAVETISRIVAVFEPHEQEFIRIQLSSVLRGVLSQRLIPTVDGNGRVPAVELLKVTSRAKECIADPYKTVELRDVMMEGFISYGMQTFDQSLMGHYKRGLISKDVALQNATNRDDFELRLSGVSGTSDASWDNFENAEEQATSNVDSGELVLNRYE